MIDDFMADADRLSVAQKHRLIRQALLDELGPLSADELLRVRDARYGLKELVDDAGTAWAIYQEWYGAHRSDMGRPNEGRGFSMFLPDWRQANGGDKRTMAEMYADPEDYDRPPLKQGRGPMIEAGAGKDVKYKDVQAQAEMNSIAYKFQSDRHKERWISEQKEKWLRQNTGNMRDLGIKPPTEWIGTLFLYWTFEATAQFYGRCLPDRDRRFKAHRERNDKDCNTVADLGRFSEAARLAFTLAKSFEPGYVPKHCHDIVDLWNHAGTNQKKINRRNNMRDRLFLANGLFNPMREIAKDEWELIGAPYQPN